LSIKANIHSLTLNHYVQLASIYPIDTPTNTVYNENKKRKNRMNKEAERKLVEAIFGDQPLKKSDCETCPYQYDCMYETKEGTVEYDVNGCKV
jgi:hypothetical protein